MFKKIEDLQVGTRGAYLWDEEFKAVKLLEIPKEVAEAYSLAAGLVCFPVRYNKEWQVVAVDDYNGRWLIIYNHDGRFYLYAANIPDEN
ncbi:MAG: hypothetical protein IPJ55_17160 [Chloracidobacterium sp.]|nr:hypothetical protein [Chloracidobacterium sp.]